MEQNILYVSVFINIMKKHRLVLFLIIAVIWAIIGCDSINQNHLNNINLPKNNEFTMSLPTISANYISKVKQGMTIEEVRKILGNGFMGEHPTVSIRYFSDDGVYDILFFKFYYIDILNTVWTRKFTGKVTGIYYSPFDSKGYFILPEDLMGENWKSLKPIPKPSL